LQIHTVSPIQNHFGAEVFSLKHQKVACDREIIFKAACNPDIFGKPPMTRLILYLESRLKQFREATYDPDYIWKVAYDSEMFGKPPMTLKLYSEIFGL
jgi:hypothetical protein